jgi:outer membrane receptor for Fe3+-dicitrate
MMNSDLLINYSRFMAQRLQREAPNDREQQIRAAWQLIYSRPPEPSEQVSATRFLSEQIAAFAAQPEYQPKDKKPPQRSAAEDATALMCQMLLSSNEFLYVD